MVTNNIVFSIDGNLKKDSAEKIIKDLSSDVMFSGSIECKKNDYKSTYVFNKVDVDTIGYILNIIKNNLSEVKVEIQTYDGNAKKIQQESIKKLL